MASIRILITASTADACDSARVLLAREPGFDLAMQVNAAGQPLLGMASLPEVLVVVLVGSDQPTLDAIAPYVQRVPTIVIGPASELTLIRGAMRMGVRDYLPSPANGQDLIEAIRRLASEHRAPVAAAPQGTMLAVINVKGGSGASFIAASLAHLVALQQGHEVGLLDLDLQFGALPLQFDLQRRSSLLSALASAAQIDELALRGYMSRHDSGVQVLSAMSEPLALPWEVPRESLLRVVDVMRRAFPLVVVDLPRQLDPLSTAIFEHADHILLVSEQSFAHTRDAKRMQQLLLSTIGVPRNRMTLVLNRYVERSTVREKDIRDAVDPARMVMLPNDFRTVSETLDIGLPVFSRSPDSEIARAIKDLARQLQLLPSVNETVPARKRSLRTVLSEALRGT